jgi:hypothetical protein
MRALADYLGLVTGQHRHRPRYRATIEATLAPLAEVQGFLEALPAAFDVDLAVGVQLDAVGAWVGISRRVAVPLAGVYFSFDEELLGFDLGSWFSPFSPSTGLVELDDETFRTLIRVRIAANSWDGRAETAAAALAPAFPANPVLIEDRQNMTIVIALAGPLVDAVTRALLRDGYLPFKPVGVGVDYLVPTTPGPLFAFDVQTSALAGFDTGGWAAPA